MTKVENQFNKKIKALGNDRCGEYESLFVDYCAQYGIIHETTSPYSPKSNEIVEQKNFKEPYFDRNYECNVNKF